MRRRRAGLVALQGADQVPFETFEVGERIPLGDALLDVILPEGALAESVYRPDGRRRKGLADGQEPHGVARTARRLARPCDARLHGLQPLLVLDHNQMTPA